MPIETGEVRRITDRQKVGQFNFRTTDLKLLVRDANEVSHQEYVITKSWSTRGRREAIEPNHHIKISISTLTRTPKYP